VATIPPHERQRERSTANNGANGLHTGHDRTAIPAQKSRQLATRNAPSQRHIGTRRASLPPMRPASRRRLAARSV